MDASDDRLKDVVLDAVRSGPLAETIDDVQIDSAHYEEDDAFLRIALKMRLPDRDVDAELEKLLEHIEHAVAAVDDRFPSVRFLDAA